MGIESLTIELDNPVGIYFPGEEVSGVVHISNVSSKILKGIYLECQGCAKFCFKELSSQTYYSAEETYLDLIIPLITNEGREKFELVSGVHQFPFVFRSSRQANGKTCYIPFTGVLKPSWKPNYEYVLAFTVKTIVDLNTIPKAALPTQSIKTKPVFPWFCCRSGLITVTLYLDRTGYVAGETILLHADVDNQSMTTLLGATVFLIESVDFHTHNKSKTYERVLCEQKRRGRVFQEVPQVFPIVTPTMTPYYLHFCDIIDVSYKIEFRLIDSESPTHLKL
ncbi:hypothetical protein OUZ56_017557 [Daphnia magna]|uniref:Arrestin C-terminal-like domain-containing protein n=1 Tax=Daphnia magna TaxID=35525 RepID=A0ABR0AT35_9CRUS|nr:hypothetical protein OUZ56_017557 [Daphnia magna]